MTTITYTGHPPVGSIVQFYDTTDPDGWVICDGVTRTSTDNRYAKLAVILNRINSVSTNTANSLTPPNLKGNFLFGTNTVTSIGGIGGSLTKTIATGNLPAHNHPITDPGHGHTTNNPSHNHTLTDPGHYHTTSASDNGGVLDTTLSQSANTYQQDGFNTGSSTTGISISSATTAVTVNNSTTSISIGNTGSGNAMDIMPPYMTINHIMKY
jgi:microcystin-dependent protein